MRQTASLLPPVRNIRSPHNKTVSLRQSRLPVYYEDDAEATGICLDLFRKLDTDGSGYLCQDELAHARNIMLSWTDPQASSLSQMVNDADSDNDGRVDEQEWHRFASSLYQIMGRKQFISIARDWVAECKAIPATSSGMKLTNVSRPSTTQTQPADDKPSIMQSNNIVDSAGKRPVVVVGPRAPAGPAPGFQRKPQNMAATQESIRPAWGSGPGTRGSNRTSKEDTSLAKQVSASPASTSTAASTGQPDSIDKEMSDAAMAIQRITRGKQARKSVTQVKEKKKKTVSIELAPTTLAELWEILTMMHGSIRRTLDVDEFVDLFTDCRESGLTVELAQTFPMHFTEPAEPEDMSNSEFAHLCGLVLHYNELDTFTARQKLEEVKESCRQTQYRYVSTDQDSVLGYRQFRKVMEITSDWMRIDIEYIVFMMLWRKTRQFELGDTLVAELKRRVGHKGRSNTPDETEAADMMWTALCSGKEMEPLGLPDLSLVPRAFTVHDFTNFMYNSMMLEKSNKHAFGSSEVQVLYKSVRNRLHDLVNTLAESRRRPPPKVTHDDGALHGRTQFEVLMAELFNDSRSQKLFKSPLHMAARLIQWAGTRN